MTRFEPPERSKRAEDPNWEPHGAMLAHLATQYAKLDYERNLYRLLAYLARYARQPLDSLSSLTLRECRLLAEETNKLVEEEQEANKREARRR